MQPHGLPDFAVATLNEGRRVTLVLSGELDISTLPRFRSALRDALMRDPDEITVDTRSLCFIDARGLGGLITAGRRASEHRVHLRIVPNAQVKRLSRLTRVEEVIEGE